jgi:metal-dependent amidase/aminoacylase/carboxypeptidase family protein
MEDEVIVPAQPHRSALDQELHVLPELRAREERTAQAVHALPLFGGELLGMRGVEGREAAVA